MFLVLEAAPSSVFLGVAVIHLLSRVTFRNRALLRLAHIPKVDSGDE